MKVINLFGAPGAGKSTTMLGLTYQMKMLGLSAENTPEFFKELILEEGQHAKFGGQLTILSEQNKRLARLEGKNDFTITDCPLPLVGFYTKEDYINGFDVFLKNLYSNYDNVNYFIVRKHEFENEKRDHSEEQSDQIAAALPAYLEKNGIEVRIIESGDDLVERLLEDLIKTNVITNEHFSKAHSPKGRAKAKIK
jgi:hypothetical protein